MNKVEKKKVRNLTVYVVLRFLVILTAVFAFLRRDFDNFFGCILVLAMFTVPSLVEGKLKIDLPDVLESIIYLFIFSSQILGEMRNFYTIFPFWDTMLHTINGFIFAGIGFALIDLLNKNDKVKVYLSPIYVVIVALSFSITIGTCWEFFEYAMDEYTNIDMQKDDLITDLESVYLHPDKENIPIEINDIEYTKIVYDGGKEIVIDDGYLDVGLKDTMKDMIVNAIGAVIFSFFGYFYVKSEENYKFAKHFIPKKKK